MTYKEALIDAMEPIEDGDLKGNLAMPFPYFVINISIMFARLAHLFMRTNLEMKEPSAVDLIEAMEGGSIRMLFDLSGVLHVQIWGFISWLMNQEKPDDKITDDEDVMWYDYDALTEKWSEYAKYERERINNE